MVDSQITKVQDFVQTTNQFANNIFVIIGFTITIFLILLLLFFRQQYQKYNDRGK